MAKAIGPTFYEELKAAGLDDKAFSWGTDGRFEFKETMSKPDIEAVLAVYAAHDPTQVLPPVVTEAQRLADLEARVTELEKT